MRRLMLLAAMLGMVLLVASPAMGQSGADGSFNCEDFEFQEDAQAFFDQDPSDPDGLDGSPGDAFTGEEGVACEELPGRGEAPMADDDDDPTAQYEQYEDGELLEAGGDLPAPSEAPASSASDTMTALPDTGGASLMDLGVGALLLGGGLLVRRR